MSTCRCRLPARGCARWSAPSAPRWSFAAGAAGRLLREHAVAVLAQVDRMRGDLSRLAEGLVASVRLAVNTSAAETFLPALLIEFLAQRPDIDVHLRERPSREIVNALARGDA